MDASVGRESGQVRFASGRTGVGVIAGIPQRGFDARSENFPVRRLEHWSWCSLVGSHVRSGPQPRNIGCLDASNRFTRSLERLRPFRWASQRGLGPIESANAASHFTPAIKKAKGSSVFWNAPILQCRWLHGREICPTGQKRHWPTVVPIERAQPRSPLGGSIATLWSSVAIE